jgi:hypothetical protein
MTKEVADSIKPGGWLHTSIIEVGMQSIRMNLPENNKKVIMPLRVVVSLVLSKFHTIFARLTLFAVCFLLTFFWCFIFFQQIWMQELNWSGAEINRLFSHENRLDLKDMVCNFFH